MVKAILFDLDGTLADTDPLHLLAWREVLAPYGLKVDPAFYRERISGRLNPEIVRDLLGLEGEEAERLIATKEARFRELAQGLRPTPGLPEFLERIREKGLLWGVVTNAPRENARHVLEALGLRPPLLVLAEEVGRGKPDPLPYQLALRRLGVALPGFSFANLGLYFRADAEYDLAQFLNAPAFVGADLGLAGGRLAAQFKVGYRF